MPHHKHDPDTDTILHAEELKDGMVVLMQDVWWAKDFGLEQRRRLGQWCTIHKVEIVAGVFVKFVAEYKDSYLVQRIHPTNVSDWIVKKYSIPVDPDEKALTDALELERRTEIAFQLIKAAMWDAYKMAQENDPAASPDINQRALNVTDEIVKALSGQ